MKRCFYIANAHDGSYFFISDDIEEYFQKMAAYAMNLKKSKKLNHYTFGSIEMTESEYYEYRVGAESLEKSQIKMQKEQEKRQKELQEEAQILEEKAHADTPTPLPRPKKPHLRLV